MATRFFIAILLSIFSFSQQSDIFDSILDDVNPCKNVCKNTYTPHTFEKSGHVECCERGCRLYSVMEFISNDVNQTTDVCITSCKEAYSEKEEFEACSLGCHSQKPFLVDGEQDVMAQMSMGNPLEIMHNMYSSLFSQLVDSACVSWSIYMRDADGSVVIVKHPQTFVFVDVSSNDQVDVTVDEYKTPHYLEMNIEPIDNSATPFLKHSQIKSLQSDALQRSARDMFSDAYEQTQPSDWLSCVAKKTGVPRLVLSWLLLFCAVVMIWMCLSAAVTAPDQKVSSVPETQKLSINGDEEVIAELLAQGIKPSYPQSKTELSSLPIRIQVHRL